MRSLFAFDLSHLRGDIYGGLTAGVVAIPLALAFGVASGLGPMAGMFGAIFVGFFAAMFGGTPTNVSGPTGPMVVVLAGLAASLSGDVGIILTAVVLAGVFQISATCVNEVREVRNDGTAIVTRDLTHFCVDLGTLPMSLDGFAFGATFS